MSEVLAMPRLSVLDLASVTEGSSISETLHRSVEIAQHAEKLGYNRVWYAEHHNMPAITSSATSVLIAHVAAHTQHIRLGAGGVMLPNHSPLVIAEQFGMLAELHPGRIDLGVGRAPGSDGATFRALRRSVHAADQFPADVRELQRLFSDEIPTTGVNAYPGRGTNVPVYVLGSSLFGANLAAQFGLPYAYASHFAPNTLMQAVQHYRDNFVPSHELTEPYVLAGINVVGADTNAAAELLFENALRERVRTFLSLGRERKLTREEADQVFDSPAARNIREMMTHTAYGDADQLRQQLAAFAHTVGADELITVHHGDTHEERLTSLRVAAPIR